MFISSPAKPIRAVFFDAVGTLLHPAVSVVDTYRTIANKHGANLDEKSIRHRLRESFAKQEELDHQAGWRTSESREVERWRSIVSDTLRETADLNACFRELWDWYRVASAWAIQPETGAVLAQLANRGLILGMASNFDARLRAIVDGIADLAPVAERCVISSVIGWRKPGGEFFNEVIAQSGCAAGEILFVGDDVRNDFEGAQQAGMRALLFDPTYSTAISDRIGKINDVLDIVAGHSCR